MESTKRALIALFLGAMAVSFSAVLHARDRGINQPGAADNRAGGGTRSRQFTESPYRDPR